MAFGKRKSSKREVHTWIVNLSEWYIGDKSENCPRISPVIYFIELLTNSMGEQELKMFLSG